MTKSNHDFYKCCGKKTKKSRIEFFSRAIKNKKYYDKK